jgi:flagellin
MRAQIRGLDQASRNSQDGISLIQTAEGALSTVNDMVIRIRELVVQSGNDTNTDNDRGRIQEEIDQLITEINEVADRTEFNTMNLLGTGGGATGLITDLDALDLSALSAADLDDLPTLTRALNTIQRHLGMNNPDVANVFVMADWTNSGAMIADLLTFSNSTPMDMAAFDGLSQGFIDMFQNATGLTWVDPTTISTTQQARENASILDAAINLVNSLENGGEGREFNFQVGANSDQQITVNIGNMNWNNISGSLDIDLEAVGHEVDQLLDRLDDTLNAVTAQRSELGAVQNRLEYTIENLDIASENLSAAESRIRDTDMAKEMMKFTQSNVLQQAAISMLAQANQGPQSILQLLG